jgi:hypothetical protein
MPAPSSRKVGHPMTKAIDDWLVLFETLTPEDGKLTTEIIKSVGGLPIAFHPSPTLSGQQIVILRQGAQAEAKAYAVGMAELKSTEALGRAAMWRSLNAKEKQEREWAISDYWLAVKSWIDQSY